MADTINTQEGALYPQGPYKGPPHRVLRLKNAAHAATRATVKARHFSSEAPYFEELYRMQFTLHAIHRRPHGASR